MESISKRFYKDKEILVVDYSNSKGEGLIEIMLKTKALLLAENKTTLVLSVFGNKNYITPNFIRQLERELPEVESLIAKNTVVGLSEIQKWILKGVNLWYKRKIHYFDSVEEALEFLVRVN